MAYYQNTSASTSNSALVGGFTIQRAASVAGSYTNIGLARNLTFTENMTMYSGQADNGLDPITGVGRHTLTISFEMLEFYLPYFDAVRGTGFDSESNPSVGTYITGGSVQSLTTGGYSELTASAFKFTNAKLVSGATVETYFMVYKAYLSTGMSWSVNSDNAEDPVNVVAVTVEAMCDTSRAAGDQLFVIESEIGG